MRQFKLSKSRVLISSAIGAAAMAGSVNAYAQNTATLEEVVVTATRRASTVQDIPLNIAAVGAQQIESQGLTELSDLLAFVPGINVVDGGGRQGNPIIVRGINAATLGPGDGNNDGGGTVATYLGDIPVFVDLKLNDLERVEVLLGPQGTLYGSGTLGGAIRYIPKKPEFEGDSFDVRGEFYAIEDASGLSSDVGFTFNKAFSDSFAIRGSVDLVDDTGFVDQPFLVQQVGVSNPDPDFTNAADVAANLRSEDDTNGEEVLSGRLAARWAPTSWLDGTLTYYFQRSDVEGRTVTQPAGSISQFLGPRDNGLRVLEPNEIENDLLALEFTADLGFAELTSATGISEFEDDGQRDQTDLLIQLNFGYEAFPSFTAFTNELGEEERFNQEIRLVSTGEGPLSWIVGGFYNQLETASLSAEFTPGFQDFAGFDRPDALEFFQPTREEITESALFGEISYAFNDRLNVTVGGRLFDFEVNSVTAQFFPLFDPSFVPQTLDEISSNAFDPLQNQEDSGSLFKFNISYDLNDDILLYGTVSEGFRIGGSNGLATCPDFDPSAENTQFSCGLLPGQQFSPGGPGNVSDRDETQFTPDTTRNFELGFKGSFADSLTVNAALFYVDWIDPQLLSRSVNGAIPITVNAEGAESIGIEVSGDWLVNDRLRLKGTFSHTQAELTGAVPSLTITVPQTGGFADVFVDGQDGDRLPGSPETQLSIFASYDLPLANGRNLNLNGSYSWQSDVLSTAGGRGDGAVLDSYGLANISANYQADNWSAAFYIDNVFDEMAFTGVRNNPLLNQTVSDANGGPVNVRRFFTTLNSPRTIGVRFTYNFTGL